MGKKRKNYEEKEKLVEFLYKDSSLIESLYSQLFQGSLSQVKRLEETSNKSNKEVELSLGGPFIGGQGGGNFGSSAEALFGSHEIVDPLDYKIKQLVDEIDPQEPTEAMSDGKVIKVSGRIEFFHKNLLEENIPWLEKAGIFRELYDMDIELEDLCAKDFFEICRKLMPPGITVLLTTKQEQEYLCLVEDCGFLFSPDKLVSLYGSGLSGEYTAVGIFSRKEDVTIEQIKKESSQTNNFARSMFVFQQAPAHVLKISDRGLVLRPLIIYRDLVY